MKHTKSLALVTAFCALCAAGRGVAQVDYLTPVEPARIALILGVADYPAQPLPPLDPDVQKLRETLTALGFTVDTAINFSFDDVVPDFRDWLDARLSQAPLRAHAVVLVFFAGHGTSELSDSYLVPRDYDPAGQTIVSKHLIALSWISDVLRDSGAFASVVIVDACRTPIPEDAEESPVAAADPATTTAPAAPVPLLPPGFPPPATIGLTGAQISPQVMVAYSTRPGRPAYSENEPGKPSVYVEKLAASLQREGFLIQQVFGEVADKVEAATSSWGTFRMQPTTDGGNMVYLVLKPSDTQRKQELDAWKTVLALGTESDVRGFLQFYRGSPYYPAAVQWLADHRAPVAPEPTPQAAPPQFSVENDCIPRDGLFDCEAGQAVVRTARVFRSPSEAARRTVEFATRTSGRIEIRPDNHGWAEVNDLQGNRGYTRVENIRIPVTLTPEGWRGTAEDDDCGPGARVSARCVDALRAQQVSPAGAGRVEVMSVAREPAAGETTAQTLREAFLRGVREKQRLVQELGRSDIELRTVTSDFNREWADSTMARIVTPAEESM